MDIKSEFTELAKAKIQDKRNLVVSQHTNGSFTLAQQIVIQEGKKQMTIFLKGSIYIDNLEGLYNLRDALNESIERIEYRARDLDSSCGP